MKIINIKQLVSIIIIVGISNIAYAGKVSHSHSAYCQHAYSTPQHNYGYIGRPYYGRSYDQPHARSYYPQARPIHHGRRIIRSRIHVPGFKLDLHL